MRASLLLVLATVTAWAHPPQAGSSRWHSARRRGGATTQEEPGEAGLEAKSDQELGLSCLNAERSTADVTAAAWALVYRDNADPLAMCMAAWSLSSRRAFEDARVFEALAEGAAPRLHEIAKGPRGPEALTQTARAFAVATKDTDVAPAALFSAIASAASSLRPKFRSEHFALLSRSFAAAKATGLPVALPFGDAAPLPTAKAVHATLERQGFRPLLASESQPPTTNFRAYAVSDFLSDHEAKVLKKAAHWQRSLVHGDAAARTSDTATLRGDASWDAETRRVVDKIAGKAAALFGLPRSCCESLQLVRYRDSSHYYVAHCDLLDDDDQLLVGGQRVGTVLVYLTTVPEGRGGETKFDKLHVHIRPTFGTALVWCNVRPDGTPDLDSLHGALPLTDEPVQFEDDEFYFDGTPPAPVEKIAVNCWIRAFPGASEL